jgi:DNA-binding transcriptional LysR family regulator
VEIELGKSVFRLTNQHTNLVEQGFDVAVRATARLGDSSLIARKLGALSLCLYSSPSYPSKYGAPTSLSDLERHQCVVFRAAALSRTWALRGASGESEVAIRGRIGGDDNSFVRAMVIAGAGIGMLPQINCGATRRAAA